MVDSLQTVNISHKNKFMKTNSVLLLLNQKNLTGGHISRRFSVNRSLVYRSIEGGGARWLRVRIAVILRRSPSLLWTSVSPVQSILDDDSFVTFLQSGFDPLLTPKDLH
jgi:hypothetical protein